MSRFLGKVYASEFIGNLTGNASTASNAEVSTSIKDYGDTSKKINIGYSGNGITGDNIKYIAGYTTGTNGATANIKDVSKDALRSWLGAMPPASHTHNYAGSSSAGGSANSAVKLDSSAGSSSQPVYFSGGKPVACGYTINTSVPSGAKFTDTNTWRPLGTTADTACAGNDSRLSNARPASDVYSWAKASSKPSYSWNEISGKPGTFAPSGHNHTDLDTIGTVGYYGSDTANSSGWYKVYSTTLTNYNDHVARLSIVSGYNPIASGLLTLHLRCDNTTSLKVQQLIWETRQGFNADNVIINTNGNTWTLYLKITNSQYGRVKIRVIESLSTSGNWNMSLSNNSTKESANPTATATAKDGATVNYANSAGSVAWSNVSGKPSSLPASDVYSWAKASSKPSYSKSEIGLGNVDNTADSQKSVKYAISAGSANSASTAGSCSGNSTTATSVIDYGATSAKINIGYSGNGISGDAIKFIAGYTTGTNGATANIKDVSKDALKSWLGTMPPSSHTHSYAGSSSAGGSANSAVKLDSSAGSAESPVYFSSGKPATCSFSLLTQSEFNTAWSKG